MRKIERRFRQLCRELGIGLRRVRRLNYTKKRGGKGRIAPRYTWTYVTELTWPRQKHTSTSSRQAKLRASTSR